MRADPQRLERYQWLVREQAAYWLDRATHAAADPLRLQHQLRRHLEGWQARLIGQQVELRRRAAGKFRHANQMMFTATGLEQSTDDVLARYKSRRFPNGLVVDLCCGVGGDLSELASGRRARGVDLDPVTSLLADWNLRHAYRRQNYRVLNAPAEIGHLAGCHAWHADPDRRASGRRTIHGAAMSPTPETLRIWLEKYPHAAIKLAPATPQYDWPGGSVREWIGGRGQCQQQVVWTGNLVPCGGPRRATVVESSDAVWSIDGSGAEVAERVDRIARWVFFPAAVVAAAGLVGRIATELELSQFGGQNGYLTGEALVDSPLATALQVVDVVAARRSTLRSALKAYDPQHIEWKKRGTDVEMKTLQTCGVSGGGPQLTVLITSVGKRVVAILAKRVATTRSGDLG